MLPNLLGFIPPAILGAIILLLVAYLLVTNKVSMPVAFIGAVIVFGLLMGFDFTAMKGFLDSGMKRVIDSATLFGFAIMFFSMYNEIGVFDVLVAKLMRFMKNRIEVVLLLTMAITIVSNLDGSGATTALVTLPAMCPIFDKMKIDRRWLMFYFASVSGIWSLLPWNATLVRLSSAAGIDPLSLFRWTLPALIGGTIAIIVLSFALGIIWRKKGKGMTDEEFEAMRNDIITTAEPKVSKPKFIFDIILFIVLILALLLGWVQSNIAFYIAFALCIVVNFKTPKEQMAQLRKHAGPAFTMILGLYAIALYMGFMQDTGLSAAVSQGIVDLLPTSLHGHLLLIYACLALIFAIFTGSGTQYLVMMPILAGSVVSIYGETNAFYYACAAVVTGTVCSLNLVFHNATPYLALGLIDMEMKDHFRHNAPKLYILSLVMVVIMVIFGRIPL